MNQQSNLVRGMNWLAEYFIAVFAAVILYLTLGAAAYLGYEMLLSPGEKHLGWTAIVAGGVVVLLGFVLSVGVIFYSIKEGEIDSLRAWVLFASGLVVAGMLIVHGKMCAKALGQEYELSKFTLHGFLLGGVALTVVFLEHIRSDEGGHFSLLGVYAGLLLFQEMLHFLGMIAAYVFSSPKEPERVAYDLMIFVLAFVIALVFSRRFGKIVNLLAFAVTKTILDV